MRSPMAVHLALRLRPLFPKLTPPILATVVALGLQTTAFAQGVNVSGRVLDAELNEPLGGAIVELATGTGSVLQEATTNEDGLFRLTRVPEGRYTLIISTLGYETQRIERLSVGSEPVNVGQILLVSRAFQLNPIVVTTSRQEEKALESPAAIYTVTTEEVEEKTASTPADHVIGLPGVDNVTTGLQQHNVVARGFNNVFSGALFVLTDNRWASVPSLRFNAYNLIPSTNDDIERIEMVLGPGSALYGPNVDKGVMHIITRSPLDHQGTTVSLVGGARGENNIDSAEALWQGVLRHAGLFSDNVGYKISAMYFTGNDWHYVDPVEFSTRQELIDRGADADTLKIGNRDFNTDRLTADARVDWRLDDESSLIFAGGLTSMFSSIEMTGLGAAQAKDWTYWYLQTRFRRGNLFAQGYLNMSNAGESYLLRDGNLVSDNSYLWAAQLQHAPPMGTRQRWVYGADLIRTVPRTDGSIHGRNENNDDIWEVGGYLQSETELSPKFDLVLAARLDWHSVVEDFVFSPRAGIVYKPTTEHSFRATYNRAFSQPTSINFSLDLQSSPTLGPFTDYGVRALGVPAATGLTFRRDCGGLCIRSPFASDPTAFLAPDAIQNFWNEAIDGVNAILASDPTLPPSLDPGTEAFLRSLDPTGQVGTVFKTFDEKERAFGNILSPEQAAIDVAPLVPSITNTFEIGYKGLISDRLLVGVDAYWQRIQDFIGPLRFETPSAFYNPQDLAAFLLGSGVPAANVPLLVALMGNVPLGTATWEQVPAEHATDLYLTYRNFGDVDVWGVDFGLTFLLTDQISLSGSYSLTCGWIDSDKKCKNFFPNLDNIGDVALNSPRNKAMLSGAYRNTRMGFGVELRGRYVDSYPVNSGVYSGYIPSFVLFDANVSYALPIATATELTLTGTNIFDEQHQEMVGAPFIGRTLMLRLRQSF